MDLLPLEVGIFKLLLASCVVVAPHVNTHFYLLLIAFFYQHTAVEFGFALLCLRKFQGYYLITILLGYHTSHFINA